MSRGRARLAIGKGISVWALEAPAGFGDLRIHSHHAIQITASPTGQVTLTDASGDIHARCVAVASDAPHRLDGQGLLLFIFVEPESVAGRTLSAAMFCTSPLVEINSQAFLETLIPLQMAFDKGISVEDISQHPSFEGRSRQRQGVRDHIRSIPVIRQIDSFYRLGTISLCATSTPPRRRSRR